MDGSTFELPLFLIATFAGAFVAGPVGLCLWLGRGRVNEMTFRRIVLALLFASGAVLVF